MFAFNKCQCIPKSIIYLQQIRQNGSCTVHEIRIPVPWGFIRGKWWGRTDQRPILGVHGFLDNCGTFKNIAPLISDKLNLGILAVDLPGNGLSSNFPIGSNYNGATTIISVERIRNFMGWKKCSLLGHSYGANESFLYSSIFGSKNVDFLITLDRFVPVVEEEEYSKADYDQKIRDLLRYETYLLEEKTPSLISYEEGIKKLRQSRYLVNVPESIIKVILERQLIPSKIDPTKYYFTVDPRAKIVFITNWTGEDCIFLVQKATMPILNIKTDTKENYGNKDVYYKVIDILKKNNPNFINLHFDLNHFTHLETPEKIINPIIDFIARYNVEDRSDQKKGIFEEIRFNCKENLQKD